MATTVNIAGLATIKIGTGGMGVASPGEDGYVSGADTERVAEDGGLETLGYTRNGAQITYESQMEDFKADANCGENGAPVEVIQCSETARVRLELTKWSRVVEGRICRVRRLAKSAVPHPGTPAAAGSLIMANAAYYRLLISTSRDPINFLCAIPRAPIEINRGTKHSTLILVFDCYKHPTTGVLYNSTST